MAPSPDPTASPYVLEIAATSKKDRIGFFDLLHCTPFTGAKPWCVVVQLEYPTMPSPDHRQIFTRKLGEGFIYSTWVVDAEYICAD